MGLFDEAIEKQLKELFAVMPRNITIVLFTDGDCYTCPETLEFVREISAMSDKIHFENYDVKHDIDMAGRYEVEMAPCIILLDSNGEYSRVKFNGIPVGHEINSFISALLEVSGVAAELPVELTQRIDAIKRNVNIKVFVTLSCPYCAGAVIKAHKLALMNHNITSEMIESQTFANYASVYNVSGVPKIVINETVELLGDQPIEAILDAIESL